MDCPQITGVVTYSIFTATNWDISELVTQLNAVDLDNISVEQLGAALFFIYLLTVAQTTCTLCAPSVFVFFPNIILVVIY